MKALIFCNTHLFVLLIAPLCYVQGQINPGAYQAYTEKNTVVLEKEEIILYPDRNNTFEYRYHSDEATQEKYGTGKYRQSSKKLILKFDETNPPLSFVEVLNQEETENSLTYQFDLIESQTGEPVVGANVSVVDHMNKVIAQSISNEDGYAIVTVSKSSYPSFFLIESQKHVPLRDDLEAQSSDFLAYMAHRYGEIIKNGTVLKFEIMDIQKDSVQLKRDDKEKYFALKNPE